MSERYIEGLGIEELLDLSRRVFASRSPKLEEAAGTFELDALCSTLVECVDAIAASLVSLPATAFHPQPDDIDGSDVWSAGQIVAHLVEMDIAALVFWEAVCNSRMPDPPSALLAVVDRPPDGIDASLAAVDAVRSQHGQLTERLRELCTGDETAIHFALGQTSVRAALLGTCFHLVDHLQQLQSLAKHTQRPEHVFTSSSDSEGPDRRK